MKKISRRKFIKKTSGITSGVMVLGSSAIKLTSCSNRSRIPENLKAFIPMPIQVVIDDVGWWSGEDGSEWNEPFRTGIDRDHVPADYQAIVDLGRALDIRPQAAFILCEWDKENILRELPTSTWMGDKWDNSKWVGPWLEETADIIKNNQRHFEITLHGIGHEYWAGEKFTRAEWTDSDGRMRPRDQVEKHLEYFKKIMDQHNLGPFPESFVPAAFRHSFGPSEGMDVSIAEIFKAKGISYINTPFSSMFNKERCKFDLFGFDAGVMTIDRGKDLFPWNEIEGQPSKEIYGPTCGMHWPNLLHPDPERNREVIEGWVNYLRLYNKKPDMMLAPDSVAFQHQLAHNTLTKLKLKDNSVELDFTETDKLTGKMGKEELTLKVSSKEPLTFSSESIDIVSKSFQKENEFLYILNLNRGIKELKDQVELFFEVSQNR